MTGNEFKIYKIKLFLCI